MAERGKQKGPIPPLDDHVETIERVLSKRQLKIEMGDIVIIRAPKTLVRMRSLVYELRIHDTGHHERFTTLEHATARGDELARQHRSRLFYRDSEDDAPHLLKDARQSGAPGE